MRGFDDGRGADINRALGSFQVDDFKSHTHDAPTGSNASGPLEVANSLASFFDYSPAYPTSATGGVETRPRNVALLACIKY